MDHRVLVTYATRAGSTAEVAAAPRPVADVSDLSGYQAAVIGSPLHSGEWLPEALVFVARHQAALRQMPTALFLLCMLDGTEETRRVKEAKLESVRHRLKPVAIGVFAGAMDYGKLPPIERLKAQTKGLPEGDFRDWEAIRRWAADLRPALAAPQRR